MKENELTPKEKAAILLISLGKDYAADLFKHLSDEEISDMTLCITTTHRVEPDTREYVINEFYDMCVTQKFMTEGGIDFARNVLEQALGADKADEMIKRLSSSLQARPFEFLRRVDSRQIINVIHNEHPQIIALVLSYTDPKKTAEIISSLPTESQTEIITRISGMGSTSPEFVKEAERIIERKIMSMGINENINVGGIDAIVDVISSLDRSSEKNILESLDVSSSELADEIRKRLFVFEDITKLDSSAVQSVLREVNNQDIATALKSAGEDVKKTIFNNMSKRLQDMIKDDMEVMGPVRVRDVEEAQQRIVNVIRKLEDDGEIIIARGEGDELIV
jgi:flagellar motor switch protein FliG